MSKITRKKSTATSPANGSRMAAKKASAKAAKPSVRSSTKKSTSRAGKKPVKAPTRAAPKSPAKKSAEKPAKKPAETSAKKVAKKSAVKSAAKPAEAVTRKPKQTGPIPSAPKSALTSRSVATSKPSKKTAPAVMADAEQVPVAPVPMATVTAPPRPTLATEGALAVEFQLPRDGGEQVSLADYHGQKLVMFFYPRADTPGCTREAMDFTRLKGDFAAAGTAVIGVSADPIKAQESFRNKHELSVALLSDETHAMLEAYGAWGEKSMYGKTFHGVLRTTVLIDADGRVVRIWRNVKVDGHAEDVLSAARDL
jgi:thioredoxin-dependent peroxiredoxin